MIAIALHTDKRLTNSRKSSFDKCKRKHFFEYELGIRRATAAQPLRFGSAMHVGRDLLKKGHGEPKAIAGAIARYDATCRPDMSDDQRYAWLVEREQIVRLLGGYSWRWFDMEGRMKTVASEFVFDMPLVNPETGRASRNFTLAGIIDGISHLGDSRLANEELKTTGDDIGPGSDYWKALRIDMQVSLYFMAARHKGFDVQTSLYDVIHKPKTKPKALAQAQAKQLLRTGKYASNTKDNADVYAEYQVSYEGEMPLPSSAIVHGEPVDIIPTANGFTIRETIKMYGDRLTFDIGQRPDTYYARHEIPRLQADLDEAQWDLWQTAKMLRDCQRYNRWPRATRACTVYGRCPFFDLCTTGYDPESGEIPDGYIRVDSVHQELAALGA